MCKHVKNCKRFLCIAGLIVCILLIATVLLFMQVRWLGWLIALAAALAIIWLYKLHWKYAWQRIATVILVCVFAFTGIFFAPPLRQTFRVLPNDTGWTPPDGYTLEIIQLANAKLEMLNKTDASGENIILQLHGGAFVSGMNNRYRDMAVRYSTVGGDCVVASLNYRLAPDAPYPCQQEDTMAAWRYLTDTLGYAPSSIVVAGDSAGGNLALSLGLRLRDLGESLPAGFICMSPWGDLSNSGVSHYDNATKDPSFGVKESEYDGQAVGVNTTYPDGLDATDPYLSPSFGDYSGFSPILLQAGSIEVLLSDSEMVYNNAIANGVDCTLTVYYDMFHVFQAVFALPSSQRAWDEVELFLTKVFQ